MSCSQAAVSTLSPELLTDAVEMEEVSVSVPDQRHRQAHSSKVL